MAQIIAPNKDLQKAAKAGGQREHFDGSGVCAG